ncbi:helix-turn-helix domain-containing protein [Pedobacter sp. KLB.chiD]|uniref:helix-turn-helix domain-containing protein n=1 Tax=Pedobacter sp. KLB.chiD TaxID=3387402 RepID=UPI00399BE2EA
MTIENFIPTDTLRPFIRAFRIIESQEEMTNIVLPDTSIAVALRYRGQTSYMYKNKQENLPDSTITGLRKSARVIHYLNESATFIILFTETGAKAFFDHPIDELFGESVSLDNFFEKQKIAIIVEQLAKAKNNIQRIITVENFLLSNLLRYKNDILISTAIEKIYSSNGAIKIKKLADDLYLSQDAFEKRFRKAVGSSPKQFSSIIQLKIITTKPLTDSLVRVALNNGFYDQSHFNKSFKLFTGVTPLEFYKSPDTFC